jgi:hypothetical protein
MDEMCQDLGMPGGVKNAGRPFRSVEAFHHRWRAKILVRLVERDRCSKSATVVVQVAIKNRSIIGDTKNHAPLRI